MTHSVPHLFLESGAIELFYLQSLDGYRWLVCSVCACASVCVYLMFTDLRQNYVSLFLLIFSCFICSRSLVSSRPPTVQARRELRRLKEEARRKHAVAVIWAYWQGLKVPTSPTAQP